MNKSVYEKLIAKERIDNIGIFLQCIVIFALIISVICFFFVPELEILIYAMLGCTFVVMSYNNYRIFKRKGGTIVYTLMGVLFLYQTVMMLYGK